MPIPEIAESDNPEQAEREGVQRIATFFAEAINELGGFKEPALTRVLDFGCGRGLLVDELRRQGFDAYGTDIMVFWSEAPPSLTERLSAIVEGPYRLPFDDNSFDVIVSTGVMEHAQNKADCFREIYRVLKPGGCAMHMYPGKWYLPCEPHIAVPLVNYFWPKCPRWWLGLWAFLGVRSKAQNKQSWQSLAERNHQFCQKGLSYWTTQQYRKLSLEIFGNCRWPMQFYIDKAPGRFPRLCKRLPFRAFSGVLSREVRMGFMLQKKEPDVSL